MTTDDRVNSKVDFFADPQVLVVIRGFDQVNNLQVQRAFSVTKKRNHRMLVNHGMLVQQCFDFLDNRSQDIGGGLVNQAQLKRSPSVGAFGDVV